MGHHETFDHTADLGIRIEAESLDDLFATAARALFDAILVNRESIEVIHTETVELRASAIDELLADWLGELLFRCETSHRVYREFVVRVDDAGTSLTATIAGEPIDHERHILDHEVKAVTRHGLVTERRGAIWVAELIVDI